MREERGGYGRRVTVEVACAVVNTLPTPYHLAFITTLCVADVESGAVKEHVNDDVPVVPIYGEGFLYYINCYYYYSCCYCAHYCSSNYHTYNANRVLAAVLTPDLEVQEPVFSHQ